jgi:hypothetical protein
MDDKADLKIVFGRRDKTGLVKAGLSFDNGCQ